MAHLGMATAENYIDGNRYDDEYKNYLLANTLYFHLQSFVPDLKKLLAQIEKYMINDYYHYENVLFPYYQKTLGDTITPTELEKQKIKLTHSIKEFEAELVRIMRESGTLATAMSPSPPPAASARRPLAQQQRTSTTELDSPETRRRTPSRNISDSKIFESALPLRVQQRKLKHQIELLKLRLNDLYPRQKNIQGVSDYQYLNLATHYCNTENERSADGKMAAQVLAAFAFDMDKLGEAYLTKLQQKLNPVFQLISKTYRSIVAPADSPLSQLTKRILAPCDGIIQLNTDITNWLHFLHIHEFYELTNTLIAIINGLTPESYPDNISKWLERFALQITYEGTFIMRIDRLIDLNIIITTEMQRNFTQYHLGDPTIDANTQPWKIINTTINALLTAIKQPVVTEQTLEPGKRRFIGKPRPVVKQNPQSLIDFAAPHIERYLNPGNQAPTFSLETRDELHTWLRRYLLTHQGPPPIFSMPPLITEV